MSDAERVLVNLGWPNGWGKGVPDIVARCRQQRDAGQKHDIISTEEGRCVTKTICTTCGYIFRTDSSD